MSKSSFQQKPAEPEPPVDGAQYNVHRNGKPDTNCRTCNDFKSWSKQQRLISNTQAAKEKHIAASEKLTVNAAGVAAPREDCPLDKVRLGISTWGLLHTMAAFYSDNPTDTEKRDMRTFFEVLSRLYPCEYCAKDFRSDIEVNPMPQLQKPAPEFSGTAVVNGAFKDIKLSDYKGKYLVLFFYPLDFTFVCPTEIIAFSDHAAEFRKINCELIGCSTDSQFTHLAWINTPRKQGGLGNMDIPLLADKSMKISRDYGVLDEATGIPFRGLFIIDDQQNLRQITINDLPVGRSVEETLRLVQAFQYTDKYGEVCPANWKPGQKTMVADPAKSKEYFATTP
ncbi:hypothetical protein AWZ03_012471 [Drosophila navojoa]|uniref:Uncharacterized protein n=2 Tax=Drosophila navojoa TaxID=7232 RepID=A0A484AZW2_DRONA|nr:hypothetical protein AWZ03_012471 [Drosophila navojoa]